MLPVNWRQWGTPRYVIMQRGSLVGLRRVCRQKANTTIGLKELSHLLRTWEYRFQRESLVRSWSRRFFLQSEMFFNRPELGIGDFRFRRFFLG